MLISTCHRRGPVEIFRLIFVWTYSVFRLTFRLAVYFSADYRRTEIRRKNPDIRSRAQRLAVGSSSAVICRYSDVSGRHQASNAELVDQSVLHIFVVTWRRVSSTRSWRQTSATVHRWCRPRYPERRGPAELRQHPGHRQQGRPDGHPRGRCCATVGTPSHPAGPSETSACKHSTRRGRLSLSAVGLCQKKFTWILLTFGKGLPWYRNILHASWWWALELEVLCHLSNFASASKAKKYRDDIDVILLLLWCYSQLESENRGN